MRRVEDEPIEKVTLNLYKGDFAKLRKHYEKAGAGKIVRTLVRDYLRKVEENIAQRIPAATVEPPDLKEIIE